MLGYGATEIRIKKGPRIYKGILVKKNMIFYVIFSQVLILFLYICKNEKKNCSESIKVCITTLLIVQTLGSIYKKLIHSIDQDVYIWHRIIHVGLFNHLFNK